MCINSLHNSSIIDAGQWNEAMSEISHFANTLEKRCYSSPESLDLNEAPD